MDIHSYHHPTKILTSLGLLLALLLGACSMPGTATPPALTVTVHLANALIYYGSCDPHSLELAVTLSGDTHAAVGVNYYWVVTNAAALGLTGATGSSETPMTQTGTDAYAYAEDMSGGMAIGAVAVQLAVFVRAVDASGTVLASSTVSGIQWNPCPPPSGQTYLLGQEWPLNLYYGLCITHDAPEQAGFWGILYDPARAVSGLEVDASLERASDGSTVFTAPPSLLRPTGAVTADGGVVYSATLDMNSMDPGGLLGGADGRLRWRVRGLDAGGAEVVQYGGLAQVHPCGPGNTGEHLIIASGTPPLPVLLAVTPTPTAPYLQILPQSPAGGTPTATYLQTLPQNQNNKPQVTFTSNANCRKGPGTAYTVVTSLVQGQALNVVGRNADSTWWQVELQPGSDCWVSHATVIPTGAVAGLPVVPAPPLPDAPAKLDAAPSCNVKAKTASIALSWGTVAGAAGYNLYRNGTLVTSPGSAATSYTDNAPWGTDLTYAVEAFNANGVSSQVTASVRACQ